MSYEVMTFLVLAMSVGVSVALWRIETLQKENDDLSNRVSLLEEKLKHQK